MRNSPASVSPHPFLLPVSSCRAGICISQTTRLTFFASATAPSSVACENLTSMALLFLHFLFGMVRPFLPSSQLHPDLKVRYYPLWETFPDLSSLSQSLFLSYIPGAIVPVLAQCRIPGRETQGSRQLVACRRELGKHSSAFCFTHLCTVKFPRSHLLSSACKQSALSLLSETKCWNNSSGTGQPALASRRDQLTLIKILFLNRQTS